METILKQFNCTVVNSEATRGEGNHGRNNNRVGHN